MERTFWLSWAGLLLGGGVLAASLWTLFRALRFRFKWGMPYIRGSITRATNSAVLGLLILGVGAALAGARWTLEGFEPVTGVVEVSRLRVTDPGGSLLLEMRIQTDGDGPEHDEQEESGRHVATGLEGDRWSVAGTVVAFPRWCEPLGLTTFHRLGGALDPERAAPVNTVADRVFHLEALPGWLGVRVYRHVLDGRGPLPDWTGLALDPVKGYFLAFPGDAPVVVTD